MERIVYISTARCPPDDALVDQILRISRHNNERDGLTGLLLVGGRRFLQVIEGDRERIAAAYSRIRADQRHFALVELSRKPIAERVFARWDMGCEILDGDHVAERVHQLTEGVGDPDLVAQLRSFVDHHRQAA